MKEGRGGRRSRGREGEKEELIWKGNEGREGKEQGTKSGWQGSNGKLTVIYLVFEENKDEKEGNTKTMDWKTRKIKGQREKTRDVRKKREGNVKGKAEKHRKEIQLR